jgi:hypothetical protein
MPVNRRSMVYRAWHLHPILVKIGKGTVSVDTIDSGQFLEDATARNESIYVFKDSRELCVVELSTYRQRAGHHEELMPFSIEKVAKWVGEHTGTASRALARQSFLFDGGDASSDAVAQADQVLTEHVDAVLSRSVPPVQNTQPICSTSEIDRTRRTYFYGSGAIGQTLLEEMESLRPWHFQGFIDSRQSGSCRGFPVLDLEQFRSAYRPGDQIVITSMYLIEIAKTLDRLGIPEVKEATGWYRARQHNERLGALTLKPRSLEECKP